VSEDAIKIFYSYSRKDLDMRNTLEDHLSALREAGRISTWHDLELEAGTEWEPAILNKLDTADIILLLVSRNFIASKYCYGTELKRAIARHDAGTARVIPVIMRPCDWNHSDVPFSRLNVLPTHAEPITNWANPDDAFTIVAQRIRETVDQLRAKKLSEQPDQRAQARQRQQELAKKEAEQQTEREQFQREHLRQLDEKAWQRQAECLKQQKAEAAKRQQLQEPELQWVLGQQREDAQRSQVGQTVNANELASEKGINYTHLRDMLQVGKWKEADQETARRMCEVMGRQQEGWLRIEDMQNFPSADLHTIDLLWVKHSNGKFGFSVQKRIWQECGSPTFLDSWVKFGEAVGWKKKGFLGMNNDWKTYDELTFATSAHNGHLPCCRMGAIWGGGWAVKMSLLSRRDL